MVTIWTKVNVVHSRWSCINITHLVINARVPTITVMYRANSAVCTIHHHASYASVRIVDACCCSSIIGALLYAALIGPIVAAIFMGTLAWLLWRGSRRHMVHKVPFFCVASIWSISPVWMTAARFKTDTGEQRPNGGLNNFGVALIITLIAAAATLGMHMHHIRSMRHSLIQPSLWL